MDATMGNGNDTLFLLNIVGNTGKVYAFDIQKTAIINTRNRISKNGKLTSVELINDGHENIDKYVDKKVKLIMFNLGYLPGGDHSIATHCETTIIALKKSLNLLDKNGVIILVIYYGHKEEKIEKSMLEEYTSSLEQRKYNVVKISFENQINNPPFLIVIEKR
ncbi:tRNA (mnm(5)s(2)U34)-methyltransferase [Clostridium sp. LBM24168]